jgi:small subunit ribosomal protein S19e
MQALEKIGVLEQDEEKGGRRITQSGQRDLDRKSAWSIGCISMLTVVIGIAATTIEADEEEDDE